MNTTIQDQKQNNETVLPLLLEIGTEEIPARFLPVAISDLKEISSGIFNEYRIDFQEMKTFATPRRLVLIVKGINRMQRDITKEVFGPSKNIAFDSHGNPTKAAEGFANSVGVKVSDLTVRAKGKGEYVAAVLDEKGVDIMAVLPDMLKKIILAIRFQKTMRWGNGDLRFARPIHWIVALLGTATVNIEIDGIKSSNTTRGHRFLSPAPFQIREISSFASTLENSFVVLDQEKRRNIIRKGITELSAQVGGQPVMDEELLEIVTYIVEYPVAVLCEFEAEYLALPKELLTTVMKDHQKYFAIHDEQGRMMKHFIVISNTRAENAENVKVGAERVIRARFDDAKFYFNEDRKKPLSARVNDLKLVTFHDKLGTVFEKTERIVSTASYLADALNPVILEKVSKAALLSKTDLITGVVREFPELQGVMGRYYAALDGEDREVVKALEEQYLPKSFGGKLPSSETGALLSLADKIDTIVSFFSIGLLPSGSEDPFALRRQAMGIASIILDRGYAITLKELFENAVRDLPERKASGKVFDQVLGFMEQRVEFILSSQGYAQDLVKAVLPLSAVSPLKAVAGRIVALQSFREEHFFPDFLLAIKRVHNIIPKSPLPPVQESLLSQEEEKTLHVSFTGLRNRVMPLIKEEKFSEGLKVFAEIIGPVNTFFDKVLVMDKDEAVKLNRLALLSEIWNTAVEMADFSKLS